MTLPAAAARHSQQISIDSQYTAEAAINQHRSGLVGSTFGSRNLRWGGGVSSPLPSAPLLSSSAVPCPPILLRHSRIGFPLNQLAGLGERYKLSIGVRGRAPAENKFGVI